VAESLTTATSSLLQELTARLSEPDWLRTARETAYQTYHQLPSPRLEKTDLRDRAWDMAPFPAASTVAQSEDAKQLVEAAAEAPYVYIRDGIVEVVSIPDALTDQGVIVTDLHTAVRNHEALVKQYLSSVVPADEAKWTAFNTALWHGGIFVYVPKHVELEEAIQFIYEETDAAGTTLPRALVIGDVGSRFQYVEAYLAPDERASGRVHSGVTEVVALADAHIGVTSLTQFTKGPTNYMVRRGNVAKDANVNWIVGDVGDGFSVGLVESRLEGTGSRSDIHTLGLGYGRQHLELTASMDHFGRFSESEITMHAVLRGRSNSTFRSSSHIERGAAEAASEQHDRMLVLDPKSRADAIPMLLIDDNNVKRCGHAASVGKLDENQIYYLMSRGISKTTANKMIVWGYLLPTVEAIPVESFREVFSARIDRELEK
jgi:Fe-S cluster assembly protein SufD